LLLPAYLLLSNHSAGIVAVAFSLLLLVGVFTCVVLHELGHALMARHFGIGTRDITLYPIGGVARLERMSKKPSEELWIALAGPAVNVLIAALLSLVVVPAMVGGLLHGATISLAKGPLVLGLTFLTYLWLTNLIMVGFNLLPAFPMDGGRVLRALLALRMGHSRATDFASTLGLIVAAAMGILGLAAFHNPMLIVAAGFVCLAGHQELMGLRRSQRKPALDPVPVEAVGPTPMAGSVEPGFTGFVWDRDHHAWVVWHNGKPVS
jgi:Zn-dependent protease